jgi:hypothetical protein
MLVKYIYGMILEVYLTLEEEDPLQVLVVLVEVDNYK